MHAKSGLRVVLEWKIYRPDSVIADVIRLGMLALGSIDGFEKCQSQVPREIYLKIRTRLWRQRLTKFKNGLLSHPVAIS